MAGGMPVILKVRLEDLVAVVVLEPYILLTETGYPPEQQICECISGRNGCIGSIVRYIAWNRAGAKLASQFVLLARNRISAQLKIVLAYYFGDVIAISVGGIRVVHAIGDIAGILPESAAVSVGHEVYSWENAITIAGKYIGDHKTGES